MKKLLIAFLFIAITVAFGACDSDMEEDLYGIWTVKDVTFSNSSLVAEYELAAFKSTYQETILKLNEDKTGTLRYIGKDYNISWQLEKQTNLLIFIDGVLFTEIGVSDEGLVLSVDADKVFICVNLIKTNENKEFVTDETISGDNTSPSITDHTDPNTKLIVNYGEEITVTGVLSLNENVFPAYCLKLDDSLSITLVDSDLVENFVCDTLYFYDDNEINGNYDYDRIQDQACAVTASLENYRGEGNLFLLNPTITIDGVEAESATTATQETLSLDFYAELCAYVVSNCVNYTEWWNDPTLSYTNPTHYYLGNVTAENYDEIMDKAKQLVDGVYKAGYWEIQYSGYGTILIGLYIAPNNELYFCYKY